MRTASLSDDGDRERYIAFIAPDESALKNKELQFPEYAVRECTNHKILPERLLFILLEKIISSDIALMRGIDEAESNIEEKLLAGEKLE